MVTWPLTSRVSIKESSVAKLGSVCRRIYRIFSHAYFHHRQIFDKYEVSVPWEKSCWFTNILENVGELIWSWEKYKVRSITERESRSVHIWSTLLHCGHCNINTYLIRWLGHHLKLTPTDGRRYPTINPVVPAERNLPMSPLHTLCDEVQPDVQRQPDCAHPGGGGGGSEHLVRWGERGLEDPHAAATRESRARAFVHSYML